MFWLILFICAIGTAVTPGLLKAVPVGLAFAILIYDWYETQQKTAKHLEKYKSVIDLNFDLEAKEFDAEIIHIPSYNYSDLIKQTCQMAYKHNYILVNETTGKRGEFKTTILSFKRNEKKKKNSLIQDPGGIEAYR